MNSRKGSTGFRETKGCLSMQLRRSNCMRTEVMSKKQFHTMNMSRQKVTLKTN